MAKRPIKRRRRCPMCNAILVREDLPSRPFCSDRCKLRDLGKWVSGSYVVPGSEQTEEEEAPEDEP